MFCHQCVLLQVVIPQIPLRRRELLKTRRKRQKRDVDFVWKRTFSVGCHWSCWKFCVGCISGISGAETFDELRYELYHSNGVKFDLEKLLPTSTSKRAYYQCYVWINATFLPNIDIDALEYGYLLKDGKFSPDTECQELLDDFPISCSCLTCATANICPCRRKLIPCCTFCKCSKNNACKNDFN